MNHPEFVTVFESDTAEEILLLKEKLYHIGIESEQVSEKKTSLGIPVDKTLHKLKVALKDETKAFSVIDQYWQDTAPKD